MADLERQRLGGLRQRRHARTRGVRRVGTREVLGQAAQPGDLEPRLALGDGGRHLGDRDRRGVERHRQGGDVEVAVGEDRVVVGEHDRVVGGAGELGFERLRQQLERETQRAVDLAGAAKAQRVLEPARGAWLGERAAGQQRAEPVGRPPLSGSRPGIDDTRVKRREVRAKALHRERRRDLGGPQPGLGVHERKGGCPDRHGRARADRQPVLGAQDHRREAGVGQGLRGRHELPAVLRLPLPDQAQPEVGHHAQIGGADRAAAGNAGMNPGVEKRCQTVGHGLAGPRAARAQAVEPDDHRRAGELAAERLADRGRPSAQRAQRGLSRFGAVDGVDHPMSEPGCHAVHRPARRCRPSDRRGGRPDAPPGGSVDRHRRLVAGHGGQRLWCKIATGDDDGGGHRPDDTARCAPV